MCLIVICQNVLCRRRMSRKVTLWSRDTSRTCFRHTLTFVRTRGLHFGSYRQLELKFNILSLIFYTFFPYLPCTAPPLPPIVMDKAIDLRSKCGHFRILVIGRANAGKTTLLKKVCNSVEDPEIFGLSGKKVWRTYYFRTWRVLSFNPNSIDCSSIPP